ncbi:MAG: hypothetical protein WCT19_01190 [Candidatus Paceibacterota bacterium]
MLTIQPKSKIVIKYGKNEAGQIVRAYFLVSEIGGRINVKLLKIEQTNDSKFKLEDSRIKNQILKICGSCVSSVSIFHFLPSSFLISPYQNLTFFSSQMPRAPSGDADFRG